MGFAARITDQTSHGGAVAGPGVGSVRIRELPAAVVGDTHVCPVPQPHPPSTFTAGSGSVRIGKRAALRTGDAAGCGAQIVTGAFGVTIGD
jgi:uncharacterized Zn-binding protein involved in type VI secretion